MCRYYAFKGPPTNPVMCKLCFHKALASIRKVYKYANVSTNFNTFQKDWVKICSK